MCSTCICCNMVIIPAVRYGRLPKRSRETGDDDKDEVPKKLTPPQPEPSVAPVPATLPEAAATPQLQPGLPLLLPTMEELEADELRLGLARDLAKLVGQAHDATSSYHESLRQHTCGLLVQLRDSDHEGTSYV